MSVVIVTDRATLAEVVREEVERALASNVRPPLKLLTPQEAGELLGVNRRTVLRWAKSAGLPHRSLGPKLIRFTESDLMGWPSKDQRKAS